jgi:hypothetical protein
MPTDAPAAPGIPRVLEETVIPLSKCGSAPATAARWATAGLLGADGTRVVLETARLGGRRVTSREALARFHARLNGAAPSAAVPLPAPGPKPSAAYLRRQREADAVLDAPIAVPAGGRGTRS